ncbi:hypothetical protein V6N13_088631 [Hibiscus sabdariffa]|uniref:Uncharacterized protein n=1 Tax=Hibiscus sabdariffa TaxID=183260 RepID=A0ABR2FZX6_9ROSI
MELKSKVDHEVNELKIVKSNKGIFKSILRWRCQILTFLHNKTWNWRGRDLAGGKLGGDDDGLNILFEGFSGGKALDRSSTKKQKKKKSVSEVSEGEEYTETAVEEIPAKAPS